MKEAQDGADPKDELERLKREVSVRGLAEARGVKLAPHGDHLIGLCPFHEDREPSLVISPRKNLWNCLGACGKGGSVVDWVMVAEGVSFRHAVEILRADNLSLASDAAPPPKRSTAPKLPAPFELEASDLELLGRVVEYYHETLLQSPEAREYLASRGLDDEETVSRFKLGFANRTLGYRLPQRSRKDGEEIRQRLQALGVLRESGHEHLNGSLVIPIHDAEGRVVQLYGRKITPNLRAGTPKHLYLPGPRRGIFNLAALRESREVILCEALLDALTLWRHGYHHVTTAYGINGFTPEMLEAMKAYGAERLLIAYDRDDRGDQAAAKLAERLGAEGISCFRVHFPRGMDANEYALKVTPAAQSLGVVLRAAEYVSGPLRSLSVARAPLSEREVSGGGEGERVSGPEGQAAGGRLGAEGVRDRPSASAGGEVRAGELDPTSGGECSREHRGGTGETAPEGVFAGPVHCQREPGGGRDAADRGGPAGVPDRGEARGGTAGDRRREDAAAGPGEPRSAAGPALTTDNGQPTTAPPASSPVAPPPLAAEVEAEVSEHEVVIVLEGRRWRARGLGRNLSFETLKVNLMVA